jgi:hypothetical protein
MCGIAGYKVASKRHAAAAAAFFEQLMLECQVRGRHASGFSWVEGNALRTHKAAMPAELLDWKGLRARPPLAAIGHTRYSTSGDWRDNKNTQPIEAGGVAIVHNGLVSMAEQKGFEAAYRVKTKTANDTEVLLRHVLATRGDLLKAFAKVYAVDPPIFACGFLTAKGSITVVRDHIRPLWFFEVKSLGMTGFASTKDIITRAAGSAWLKCDAIWPAEPYQVYEVTAQKVRPAQQLAFKQPSEVRFPRPSIKNKLLAKARTPQALLWENPQARQFDHRKKLRESFKQYCVAAVASWEIDPNYPLMNYLFRRYELSKSQEYWACFLYGTFYHPGSVFYVMQEFPEFEKVSVERLSNWHRANWRALAYNTDRKYEKGHFVEMFESYCDAVGGQTPTAQEEYFTAMLGVDPVQNFHKVTAALNKLWHFGRYSVYIYTECLHRCMGMPLQADTMFLKEADSPRAGLCRVLGKQDWAEGSLDKTTWLVLEREAEKLLQEIQHEYPTLGMDHWLMESCLCAYKGFFRPKKGRYLPYYLDRMAHEIGQMQQQDITQGIDWNVLWQFRKEVIIPEYLGEQAQPIRTGVTKQHEHTLRDTGRMIGLWPIVQRGLIK